MKQDLAISRVGRPVWNWKDDDCLRALIEALRVEECADDIAKRLMRSYEGALTKNAINGAMNRPNVLRSIKRLEEEDADRLIKIYRSRATMAQSASRSRKERKAKAVQKPTPSKRPPRAMSPKCVKRPVKQPEAPPPRREPTRDERAQSDAINAYLASIPHDRHRPY